MIDYIRLCKLMLKTGDNYLTPEEFFHPKPTRDFLYKFLLRIEKSKKQFGDKGEEAEGFAMWCVERMNSGRWG